MDLLADRIGLLPGNPKMSSWRLESGLARSLSGQWVLLGGLLQVVLVSVTLGQLLVLLYVDRVVRYEGAQDIEKAADLAV
jgi:hypothetical protein